MNFFNALKTAKDLIDTSSGVYTAIRASFPTKPTSAYEKIALVDFSALEERDNGDAPFRIFVSRKAPSKNAPSTVFHVIYAHAEILVRKTSALDEAKRVRNRLNALGALAHAADENHLLENFLTLALTHFSWKDVHLACALGLPTYVSDVCRRGDALSVVNSPTADEGYFPLHLAAEKGFVRLAEMLLNFDADATKCDLMGRNALHFAVKATNTALGAEVLKIIFKKRPDAFKLALHKGAEEEGGLTPLQFACKHRNLDALRLFLQLDGRAARFNCENLFAASQPFDFECLDLLLEVDPDLMECQFEPNFLLHRPFSRELLKVVAQRAPLALELRRVAGASQTPLHAACARADLDAVVALLSYGADFEAVDAAQNRPLHHAARANATRIVQILICFGADVNAKNGAGQTAATLSQNVELANIFKLVAKFPSRGAPKASVVSGGSAREVRQRQAIQHRLASAREKRGNSVRLLALDGGGIRGLVLIQILLELERRVEGGRLLEQHFDWIAGTSTGAIVALALADGVALADCLRLYLRFKDEVFSTKTGGGSPNLSPMPNAAVSSAANAQLPVNAVAQGAAQPRLRMYSAEKIEHFLQQQFGAPRTLAELKKCRVIVTATRANVNPPELILFRNYAAPTNLDTTFFDPNRVTIWKAARCSSAAPTYFPSVDGSIMDGGLMANNPALDLLVDVHTCNAALAAEGKEEKEVACVVSIGTGRMPKKTMEGIDVIVPTQGSGLFDNLSHIYKNFTALQNLKTILVEQVACSDGQVVERAQAWAHSLKTPFFRFTPQLATDVSLDETDNATLVGLLWCAKVYVNMECRVEFDSLVDFLENFNRLQA